MSTRIMLDAAFKQRHFRLLMALFRRPVKVYRS